MSPTGNVSVTTPYTPPAVFVSGAEKMVWSAGLALVLGAIVAAAFL